MVSTVSDFPIMAPIPRAVSLSGISRSSIYRLAGEGRIRIVKLGRTSLVDMTSVRAFLDTLDAARIAPSRRTEQSAA